MVNLYIEGELIDQYADESVEIVSSVLDVQDITKNTGDYSKSFTIPTSKRNNKIFKHWYNASIDGGFDARTRVRGSIDIDGVPFKTGKWLLRSVKVIKGVPDSYVINFFGETASLGEILGKDILRDLDLSTYNHDYNVPTVQLGLETGLFGGDVLYTLMSQQGMFYNSDATQDDIIDSNTGAILLKNIAWNARNADTDGLSYTDLKPSLKIIRIIEAIEVKYGITFSRDFFDTSEFNEIYMWLCPDLEGGSIGNSVQRINFTTTDGSWMNTTTDIATYVPTAGSTTDQMRLRLVVTPASFSGRKKFDLSIRDVDTQRILQVKSFTAQAVGSYSITAVIDLPQTRNIEFLITPSVNIQFTVALQSQLINSAGTITTTENSSATNATAQAEVELGKLLPDMEVVEFIKGLVQMFKLVVIGEGDDNFYINSLDAYYRQGARYDITQYLNFAEYDVERGEILAELDFKFQDPTTMLAVEYKDRNGVGYGDSRVKLVDENGDAFDGDTLTVELPFETIMYERLSDGNNGNLTPIQLGNVINHEYSAVFPAPHLHYAHRTSVVSGLYNINYEGYINVNNSIWIPSTHFTLYNPSYSLLFESETSTYTDETIDNTLYSHHYESYVQAIFNVKRRTIKVEAKLPIQIITRLSLRDVISINSLDYRINNYKYNLLTGNTSLELINGFDEYETNDLVLLNGCFRAAEEAGQYTFNVPYIEQWTITSVRVGGGVTFVTHSTTKNKLILDVDVWSGQTYLDYLRKTELTFTNPTTGLIEGTMCVVQTNEV